MRKDSGQSRQMLCAARRVVVKVGSRLLVAETGRPEYRRINALVQGIAELRRAGKEVVLVTSGAVGMGLEALGRKTRPEYLAELQTAAAVGQARLIGYYEKLFSRKKLQVGQILLNHDDLKNRTRHLNARTTMLCLLRRGIIPIVNENDVVAVEELKVGDNDTLASLVAMLVDADALVLLTSANGLYRTSPSGKKKRVPYLEKITKEALSWAKGKGSSISTGGMSSKLQAVDSATKSGVLSVIADGRKPKTLQQIFGGEDVGTLVGQGTANGGRLINSRKQWVVFFHRPRGTVVIDDGARDALVSKGRSLLPIGVKQVRGQFPAGSLISVQTLQGKTIARGLSAFDSRELEKIKGKKTAEIASLLGRQDYDEVIHRDNMVLLSQKEEESV